MYGFPQYAQSSYVYNPGEIAWEYFRYQLMLAEITVGQS